MEKLLHIIQIGVVLCALSLSCYLTGVLVEKKWKIGSSDTPILHFLQLCLAGWLIELAIFQIICIPMIICNARFTTLVAIYIACIILLCMVSILVNKKNLFPIKWPIKRSTPMTIYRKIAIFLILLQCIICIICMQISEDGIFDYTIAAHTINNNTMFRTYAYTGYDCALTYYPDRFINSWYIYRPFLAKIMNFHPTMVGRTILPPILLAISYLCYYLLGKQILADNEKIDIFIIFLSLINIFGNTRLTSMVMLLGQTENGKSIFINILLPLILLCTLKLYDNITEKKYFLFLIILNICAVAMSTTALVYSALVTILCCGIVAFKQRNVNTFLLAITTLVPNGVYLLLYMIEKKWELWI